MGSKKRSNLQEDIDQILTEFDTFLDNVFESPVSSPCSEFTDSLTAAEQKLPLKPYLACDPQSTIHEEAGRTQNYEFAKKFFSKANSQDSCDSSRSVVGVQNHLIPTNDPGSKYDSNHSASKNFEIKSNSKEGKLRETIKYANRSPIEVDPKPSFPSTVCRGVEIVNKTELKPDNEVIDTVERPVNIIAKFECISSPKVVLNYLSRNQNSSDSACFKSAKATANKNLSHSGMQDPKIKDTVEKPSCIIAKFEGKQDKSFQKNDDSPVIVKAKLDHEIINIVEKPSDIIAKLEGKLDIETLKLTKKGSDVPPANKTLKREEPNQFFYKYPENKEEKIIDIVENPRDIIAKLEDNSNKEVGKMLQTQSFPTSKIEINNRSKIEEKDNSVAGKSQEKYEKGTVMINSQSQEFEIEVNAVEKASDIIQKFERNVVSETIKNPVMADKVFKIEEKHDGNIIQSTGDSTFKSEAKTCKEIVKTKERSVETKVDNKLVGKMIPNTEKTSDIVTKYESKTNYTESNKFSDLSQFPKNNYSTKHTETSDNKANKISKQLDCIVLKNAQKTDYIVDIKKNEPDSIYANFPVHSEANEPCSISVSEFAPIYESESDPIYANIPGLDICPNMNKTNNSGKEYKLTEEICTTNKTDTNKETDNHDPKKMEDKTDKISALQKLLLAPSAHNPWEIMYKPKLIKPTHKLTKDQISSPILNENTLSNFSSPSSKSRPQSDIVYPSLPKKESLKKVLTLDSDSIAGNRSPFPKFKAKNRQHIIVDNKQLVNFDSLINEFRVSKPRAETSPSTNDPIICSVSKTEENSSETTSTCTESSPRTRKDFFQSDKMKNKISAFPTQKATTVKPSNSISPSVSNPLSSSVLPKKEVTNLEEESELLNYLQELLSSHSAKIAAGIMSVEHRGTKALELWTRRATEGYPGVSVSNMTTSWRDGLAFCALIHHFRPELIDFKSLKCANILENNALAFRVAEQHLGIPALLDAEDMVQTEVPDRLSILTYVSQFYQAFSALGLIGPGGRRSPLASNNTKNAPLATSPPKPAAPLVASPRAKSISTPPPTLQTKTQTGFKTDKVTAGFRSRREECVACRKTVFLAERIVVGFPGQLRHRTCFRCDRCATQLTLASYYETEKGQFCCETCPDEERGVVVSSGEEEEAGVRAPGPDPNRESSSDSESDSDSAGSSDSEEGSPLDASSSSSLKGGTSPHPPTPRSLFLSIALQNSLPPPTTPPVKPPRSDFAQPPPPPAHFSRLSPALCGDGGGGPPHRLEDAKSDQTAPRQSANESQLESLLKRFKNLEKDSSSKPPPSESELDHSKGEQKFGQLKKFFEAKDKDVANAVAPRQEPIATKVSDESSGDVPHSTKPLATVQATTTYTPVYASEAMDDSVQSDIPRDNREAVATISSLETNVQETKPLPESCLKKVEAGLDDTKSKPQEDITSLRPEAGVVKCASEIPKAADTKPSETTTVPKAGPGVFQDLSENRLNVRKSTERDLEESDLEVSKPTENLVEATKFNSLSTLGGSIQPDISAKTVSVTSKTEDRSKAQQKISDPQMKPSEAQLKTTISERKSPLDPTPDDSNCTSEVSKPNTSPTNLESDLAKPEEKMSVPQEINPPSPSLNSKDKDTLSRERTKRSSTEEERKDEPAKEKEAPTQVAYPTELNPFGSDEEELKGDDKEVLEDTSKIQVPPPAQTSIPSSPKIEKIEDTKTDPAAPPAPPQIDASPKMERTEDPKKKVIKPPSNPFDSEGEEEEGKKPRPEQPKKKALNPFWSEDEECSDHDSIISSPSKSKVKPPRPPPPTLKRDAIPASRKLILVSIPGEPKSQGPPSPTPSARSSSSSDQSTMRLKKKLRHAPAPPSSAESSPLREKAKANPVQSPVQVTSPALEADDGIRDDALTTKMQKELKNHTNKMRGDAYQRDVQLSAAIKNGVPHPPKSEAGEWRRKKGPAPSRPVPQKRAIRKLPMRKVQQELHDIEVKQTELERQGVLLETSIRDRTERSSSSSSSPSPSSSISISTSGSPSPEDSNCSLQSSEAERSSLSASALGIEVEDMILQLFELVNEKNELFRRQTELMYLKREKRLEEEYAELEYQIRCLMLKSSSERGEEDARLEEDLISRLLKVVEQRDAVVNCLEMERQREAVEDQSIASSMIKYQEKHIEGIESDEGKEGKKKKKKKLRLLKKKKKGKEREKACEVDADKDVDETELKKSKKKKRKNWFKMAAEHKA